MAQFFEIKPAENEYELLLMLPKQDVWVQGMDKFLDRYAAEARAKLDNLNNDHDTDLMLKTILKTIEFIRTLPFRLKKDLTELERMQKEATHEMV